jgi:DNA primase catalytic core
MARIPDSELERLKADASVEGLVEAFGVELKPAGKDLLGRCPFHEDREASLIVTPAKNLWHCFACQIGGGPIDWMMKSRGVSFRHAVELLRAGECSGTTTAPVKRGSVRALAPPVAFDAGDRALLDQTIAYYHERLKQTPEALAYLARRGLNDAELIERHRLGFADRTLGLRLPEKTRKAGHEIRSRLQKLGLLRESGHEHFNGSLVIPVIAPSGEITEVYGRKINDNLREGTPYHLYLPGPHRGVWNEAALTASTEIILCEALIDALTFWRAGYRNVTAAYGIEGFTADHLAAFQRHVTKRVLIAYDRDEAGERAAEKLAEKLIAEGLECYRIQFPKGMDANEYALKLTPAEKSLGLVIRKAVWLGKGPPPPEPPGQRVEEVETAASGEISAPMVSAEAAAPTNLTSPAVPASSPEPLAEAVNTVATPDASPLGDEVVVSYGDRRYRVRGLCKNLSYETLKINLHIAREEAYYVDTFDLYSARARNLYIVNAAKDLAVREEIVKTDLGRLLLKLEALQQSRIEQALKVEPSAPAMTEAERETALELLRDPKLLDRLLTDFDTCGLIGERTNKLVGYLAAVSRKLERPLAVLVQSSSAAGKSSLMDAVLAFTPEEERIKYSAMTGQSLFYMGETNLKHKILALVEEEGAHRASYALKLLQSEGELTIASTGKDPQTGNLVTQEYHVEGPVMMMLTTTAIEIDEELLNRCLVLSVDESREQTEAIHRLQRERRTLAGLLAGQRKHRILAQHRHAQRLLRPLKVLNPYADRLTFLSDKTRTRRDHEKYLTLIDTIALLHQYQRARRTAQENGETIEYIEATLEDIAQANTLAHEVLGRSLDELPPQTRRVLARVIEMVTAQCAAQQICRTQYRFSRRAVREYTGLSDTQLRVHLERLVQLEYLLVHRGLRGQSFVYELLFDGEAASEAPHLSGLIDVAMIATTTASSRGSDPHLAGSTRGGCGPNAAGSRSAGSLPKPLNTALPENPRAETPKLRVLRPNGRDPSYVPAPAAATRS